ncbi:Hypothetical predicted protein [Paramuricea clavata]|uniref:Uncharacterized protein n=1 Tax=Paramuricea clavata TaxID=317549 RepID=A0A6S7IFS3_PARCT|nr:Hypothetical predicted protein [Paramuricea clavata]
MMFTTSKEEREKIKKKFKAKCPEPLNRQFPERATKQDAIENDGLRKRKIAQLFPPGEDQEKEKEKEQEHPTKKTRCCKKCKQAMKGLPRSHCPTPE